MIPLFPPSSPLSPFVSPYIGLLVDRDFEHLPRYRSTVPPGIDVHPVHSTPHALPHFSIVIRRRPSPKRRVRSLVRLHPWLLFIIKVPPGACYSPRTSFTSLCHALRASSSSITVIVYFQLVREGLAAPHTPSSPPLRRRHRGRVPQAEQHICVDHPLGKHTTGPKARLKPRRRTARALGGVAGHGQNQIGPDRTALG
jgi:hypothetical protein